MASALVNLHGLSRELNLSRAWLQSQIAAGRLPYLQAGNKRRFNVEAVRRVLAERAAEMPETPAPAVEGAAS